MSDGYSPNWSPGDPLEDDEKISAEEKQNIVDAARAAGDWTEEDEAAFWADDQDE